MYIQLRASLDYNEEVHRSVKDFQTKTKLFEAMLGMPDKNKGGRGGVEGLKLEFSIHQVSCPRV